MPYWEMLLWIVFAVVMTSVTVLSIGAVAYICRENRLYSAEGKLWSSLAHTGQMAEGVIRSLRLHSGNLTRAGSYGQSICAVVFEIDYTDTTGTSRTVSIHTFVEELLVASFQEPRKAVHLLYDPASPATVVIDRERTPLELARAS
ncbi:hypothetical protein [Dyella sp. 2RAB6]|uniref:hypothetical protein n=1 Tax=Dyella sp. 2RAB6 TaxID=3232992 RepID=UPI003F9253C3